jgi:four helix bundle protein
MELDSLRVYQRSMDLAETVWTTVMQWDYFARDTVGKQLVRSADSVAANISEGYGRFHFKENRRFCYYARGSLFETRTWLAKAVKRDLVAKETYEKLVANVNDTGRMLNGYINSIGPSAGYMGEENEEYVALPTSAAEDPLANATPNDE